VSGTEVARTDLLHLRLLYRACVSTRRDRSYAKSQHNWRSSVRRAGRSLDPSGAAGRQFAGNRCQRYPSRRQSHRIYGRIFSIGHKLESPCAIRIWKLDCRFRASASVLQLELQTTGHLQRPNHPFVGDIVCGSERLDSACHDAGIAAGRSICELPECCSRTRAIRTISSSSDLVVPDAHCQMLIAKRRFPSAQPLQ
jgi:hypothetical protein